MTGALKHAMEVLENDLASSDILLVSDGELPNPPVSKADTGNAGRAETTNRN